MALDKMTGKEIWRTALPELGESGTDGAGYSSVVMPQQNNGEPDGSIVAVVFLRDHENERLQADSEGLLQIFMLGKFGLVANEKGIDIDRWKRRQARG